MTNWLDMFGQTTEPKALTITFRRKGSSTALEISKTETLSVGIVASITTLKKIIGRKEATQLARAVSSQTMPITPDVKTIKGPCS